LSNKSRDLLSVVIPAYNEEQFLPLTLVSLISSLKQCEEIEDYEIIVADNHSTDKTAEIAAKFGAKVVLETEHKISKVRNTGAKNTNGTYIVFLDADTMVKSSTLRQAYQALTRETGYGGGALVRFDDNFGKFILGKFIPSFWNWCSKTFRLAAGSFIFCKKEDFLQVGGFPESMYAGEEIEFVRKLKKINKKSKKEFLIIEEPPVITSSRKLIWYSSWKIFLQLVMILIFPFSVRFRRLCGFWYVRPKN